MGVRGDRHHLHGEGCGGQQFHPDAPGAPNSGGPSGCDLWQLDTPAGDVGTKPTITVTFSGSVEASLLLQEVSGLATGTTTAAVLDGTAGTTTGNGGSSTTSPTYSSSVASEYLVLIYGDDGGPETLGSPTGYTRDTATVSANSNADVGIAYKNSTGGSETGSWPLSGTAAEWGTVLVAFKLASGGSATVNGLTATAALAAPAGSVGADATIAGPVATAALAAPAGTPALTLPGPVATAALAAPAGSVGAGATIAGPAATAALAAPAGAAAAGVTIAGLTATAALAAPAGSVGADATIAGLVATAALAAPAGAAQASPTVAGLVATVALAAPAGAVPAAITVAGPAAAVALAAPPGTAGPARPTRQPPSTAAPKGGSNCSEAGWDEDSVARVRRPVGTVGVWHPDRHMGHLPA